MMIKVKVVTRELRRIGTKHPTHSEQVTSLISIRLIFKGKTWFCLL